MNVKSLTLPLSNKQIRQLKAGDIVYLSGTIYTARDATHKRIYDAINSGTPLPFDLKNAAIYYTGPTPTPQGHVIGSCGPTTSARMDDYTPTLLDNGLKIMIGKGKRSDNVISSIKKNTALYLVAVGGCGALCSSYITKATKKAYPDLLCEEVLQLTIKNFELLVAIDTSGNSIF